MPEEQHSLIGLHLRYRLWISELNHKIDIIRICHDYLNEEKSIVKLPEVQQGIENFKVKFAQSRKSLDELRDSFHLIKMKLGADSCTMRKIEPEAYKNDRHETLKARHDEFNESFKSLTDEFCRFQEKIFLNRWPMIYWVTVILMVTFVEVAVSELPLP